MRLWNVVQIVKGYPQGLMSKHIVELNPGDELDFKGPIQKVAFELHKLAICFNLKPGSPTH